jgi:hypothetical protein
MIRTIPASDRHYADHGWLKTRWLFSFGEYYDPANLSFGSLRVFNDDVVIPGSGFGMHGHRDMEIVTVMLQGRITHQDSMGNKEVIAAGEVQRMSAGTGIMHSEYNHGQEPVHLYQVWFPPRQPGGKPSYQQRSFTAARKGNGLVHVVSGFGHHGSLEINSDSAMSVADLEAGKEITIPVRTGGGIFIYVTSGSLTANGAQLAEGDQARIQEESEVTLRAIGAASLVIIEVTDVAGPG